jgi:hypothetical protein
MNSEYNMKLTDKIIGQHEGAQYLYFRDSQPVLTALLLDLVQCRILQFSYPLGSVEHRALAQRARAAYHRARWCAARLDAQEYIKKNMFYASSRYDQERLVTDIANDIIRQHAPKPLASALSCWENVQRVERVHRSVSTYPWRCYDCNQPTDNQCPLCKQRVCKRCAEKPYAFCCPEEETAK